MDFIVIEGGDSYDEGIGSGSRRRPGATGYLYQGGGTAGSDRLNRRQTRERDA